MLIQSIAVCPDRVDVVVRMDDPREMRTSQDPAVVARAVQLLPGLGDHRCVNDLGQAFADELADTEVPHLLEHVTLELMALAGSPRSLKGETEWDFRRDGRGVFRVSLEYDDDLVCLGAIKLADEVVTYVLGGGEPPDVDAAVQSLVSLRGWPASLTGAKARC